LKLPLILLFCGSLGAQSLDVSGSVTITRPPSTKSTRTDYSGVVVWLRPVGGAPRLTGHPKFEMRQSHKHFEPHLLVVPVGSLVSFPNLDPYFHNVFSMYDGTRFDLGLYEAGVSRNFTFTRPGVSFVFCNIHPEMSAAIVVVDSSYYAITNATGQFSIGGVPPGRYRVYAWHERASSTAPQTLPVVELSREASSIAPFSLIDTGELLIPHKNKYGRDYPTPSPATGYHR